MADDPGRRLLALLQQQAVALLDDARDAVTNAAAGASQLPRGGSGFAGTALDGHLLDAPPAVAGTPLGRRVADALRELSVGDAAGLFGWASEPVPPGGGPVAPDGIAWAARTGDVVAAVAATAPGGAPQLELVAGGAADGAPLPPLGAADWALTLGVHATGTLRVLLTPAGDPIVSAAAPGDRVTVALVRAPPPGVGDAPGVSLGAVALRATLIVDPGPRVNATGRLELHRGAVRLAPGVVTQLVPGLGPIPLDVDLTAGGGRGLRLAGSPALTVRLPVGASLPGLSAGPVDLTLKLSDADGVEVNVTTAIALTLPDAPLRLDLRGIGVAMPFGLGAADTPGLDDLPKRLGLHLPVGDIGPAGAGVAFDTPIVAATGRIEHRPSGDYAGLLSARVPPISATAYGVLGLQHPPSFAVVLSATFPPPGVQVGLGFALTGVGGVVAVNRRVDRDALMRAVADGTAAQLLFPRDLGAAADRALASLEAIFPRAPGRVVVGPMFQVSWGGRLITGAFAVLLELPEPVRLSLLGSLLIAIPDPELPLIRIEATFAGTFDPQIPSFELRASIRGTMVGVALTGDLYALIRGGDEPALVLSAGGFHPRFPVPAGIPPLQRLGMSLTPTPLIELRCQAYLAITSNTLQFGARVELAAEVAGCGLSGHLAFDVLIQRDPTRFIADASAGIAVEVFGERLVGVSLAFSLEGPARWRARGRGSIDLFLFSASFDFDETWGDAPPPRPLPAPRVGDQLAAALRDRAAWVARAPDLSGAPFVLTAGGARRLATGEVLHPQGELTVRQRAVPLRLEITRFEGVDVEPQTWDVTDPAGGALGEAGETRAEFPTGQFLRLTEDQALGRPAFEGYRAGLRLVSGGVTIAPQRDASLTFETKVITGDEPAERHPAIDAGALLAVAVTLAAAPGIDHPLWWPAPEEAVTVSAPHAVALVDGMSLTRVDATTVFASTAEAEEAAAALRAEDPARVVVVAPVLEGAFA